MRKLNFLTWFCLALMALVYTSCKEDEAVVSGPTGTLMVTQADGNNSELTVKVDNPQGATSYKFNFGDGTEYTAEGPEATHTYLWNDDFELTVTLIGTTGVNALKQTVTVSDAKSDAICNSEYYQLLTGGCNDGGPGTGKVWKFSVEVGGHGVGTLDDPIELATAGLWNSNFNHWKGENTEDIVALNILESRFTFGVLPNTMKVEATHQVNNWQEKTDQTKYHDFETAYVGQESYPFEVYEENGSVFLSFGQSGYMGYYQSVNGGSNSLYEIVKLTEDELYVRFKCVVDPDKEGVEFEYRYLRYVQEDVIELAPMPWEDKALGTKAIAASFTDNLNVTVGDETLKFKALSGTAESVSNPDGSGNVIQFNRYPALGAGLVLPLRHRLDLKTQNKFSIMAYFPTTNDYETVDAAAEPWTDSEGKLASFIRIRLGDTRLGGNDWQTEASITSVGETGKWVELTFEYKGFAINNNADGTLINDEVSNVDVYDKIYIQFGGEGHRNAGTFYVTDFKLL
ncbi:PKD domain-containing protein [Flammeovirga aprica]|uniref:PKD domain-containing protein n=1 Tax=Flammeovirga aprica JL-4 TaxID=694437 RepID=A0A7X9RXP3_9BACT|nr:PKD domain-containing protein [Flammeovirga aprica]NME70641.1 hypothetical protein [Flammeovirga aprica JL-4]